VADPVELVVGLIKANDTRKAESFSSALSSVMNRRNSNIFWRALIDKAALMTDQGVVNDPLEMTRIFVRNRLDPNMSFDNGDLPLNIMVARSSQLGRLALGVIPFDINQLDKEGRTPAMRAVQAAKSQSFSSFDVVIEMIRHPSFKPDVGDQAAHICFKGLAWLQMAAGVVGAEEASSASTKLIEVLAEKNYDFNGARETPDAKYGSTINTPLAYCIKKAAQGLEWCRSRKTGEQMGETVWSITQELMRRGADPCLQMEATDRVQLIELCRDGGFPDGMMQRLEAGLLAQAISAPSGKRRIAQRL
jgi:hypothetical protein